MALALSLAAMAATAPAFGGGQIQATRENVRQWIEQTCHSILKDSPGAREAITDLGKTVAGVCRCTRDGMWKKFPRIYYWTYDTPPYEWNKVVKEFPKTINACINE